MAYALVGSVGTIVVGANGVATSPAWGAGSGRAAGNLLVLWVGTANTTTFPTSPTGWPAVVRHIAGTTCTASIFAMIALGGDTAPIVPLIASTVCTAMLAEFSGNDESLGDQNGAAASNTSPLAATANNPGGGDQAAGELVVYCSQEINTAANTVTISGALNNGATASDHNNGSTSQKGHADFGYGITTSKASSDIATVTWTGTSTGVALAIASFKLAPLAPFGHHRHPAFRGRPASRGRFMVAFPKLWTPRIWLPGAAA